MHVVEMGSVINRMFTFSALNKTLQVVQTYSVRFVLFVCLQCFDAVGWAAGRASSL